MEASLTTHLSSLPREAGAQLRGPVNLRREPVPNRSGGLSAGFHLAGLIAIVLMMAAVSFGCGALTAAARRMPAAGQRSANAATLPGDEQPSARLSFLRGSLPKANPPVGAELRVGPSAEDPKGLPVFTTGEKPLGSSAEPALPSAALLPGDSEPSYIPPAGLAAPAPTPTPLVLPDYEIPEPTPLAFPAEALPAQLPEADTSAITRLMIPRLALDAVVKYVPFSNNTWLIGGLRNEIAWMGDTSWPGLGSNTGLAGHYDFVDGSPGPFWRLSELAPGDAVQVYTEKYLYTYTVREHILVDDSDLSVIAPTDSAQITLITCATWNPAQRVYTQRLIVYADLTAVNPLQ